MSHVRRKTNPRRGAVVRKKKKKPLLAYFLLALFSISIIASIVFVIIATP